MRTMLLLPALALLALSAACQREKTEYISVQGKIFIFNIRLARAYYTLNLNRLLAGYTVSGQPRPSRRCVIGTAKTSGAPFP